MLFVKGRLSNMIQNLSKVTCTAMFLAVALPAEASDGGSSLMSVGMVGMVIGVAVLAYVMKKFMQQ